MRRREADASAISSIPVVEDETAVQAAAEISEIFLSCSSERYWETNVLSMKKEPKQSVYSATLRSFERRD
jgi:urate oxidase